MAFTQGERKREIMKIFPCFQGVGWALSGVCTLAWAAGLGAAKELQKRSWDVHVVAAEASSVSDGAMGREGKGRL